MNKKEQLFLIVTNKREYVVTIDEIEEALGDKNITSLLNSRDISEEERAKLITQELERYANKVLGESLATRKLSKYELDKLVRDKLGTQIRRIHIDICGFKVDIERRDIKLLFSQVLILLLGMLVASVGIENRTVITAIIICACINTIRICKRMIDIGEGK